MFLFREYIHVLEQVKFYREKAVEYNGILRLSIPRWDADVDDTRPLVRHLSSESKIKRKIDYDKLDDS
jgi:hypothetical protein